MGRDSGRLSVARASRNRGRVWAKRCREERHGSYVVRRWWGVGVPGPPLGTALWLTVGQVG